MRPIRSPAPREGCLIMTLWTCLKPQVQRPLVLAEPATGRTARSSYLTTEHRGPRPTDVARKLAIQTCALAVPGDLSKSNPSRKHLAALVCTAFIGCSEDPRERAEPTAEPAILVPLSNADKDNSEQDSGNIRLAGGVDFDGGLRIDGIVVTPARIRPGQPLRVKMTVHGSDPEFQARLSLRTPRSSGREEVRARSQSPDARDRSIDLTLVDGDLEIELTLPEPWHPATAILELELNDGERRIQARRGARSDDGRALLALLPVERQPTQIDAVRGVVTLDGTLGDPPWARTPALLLENLDGEPFRGPPTELWFAWDSNNLYAAARLPDDDLWTTYSEHDDPLYKQEVFEIFIAGDNSATQYLEYEVSVRGVTFDARFPTYRRGDEAWDSSWRQAIQVDGTINNADDRDRGWSVEVALPWAEICEQTILTCPPVPGQQLRVNAFRLDKPGRKGETIALSLSPTLRPDFHAWQNAAVLELR